VAGDDLIGKVAVLPRWLRGRRGCAEKYLLEIREERASLLLGFPALVFCLYTALRRAFFF
jgi:hypothetical protein